jgi:hypothetical protein
MMDGIVKKGEEKELLPSEDFLKGLTEKQKHGLLKLVCLEEIPETQAELARALGVTERGLYNWWNDPNWCKAVHELIRKTRVKYLPMIENSLIKKARKGSYLHQKAYYRLIGEDFDSSSQAQNQILINFGDGVDKTG